MTRDFRSRIRRRVPGIAWRDELLAQRAVQVKELRQQLHTAEGQVIKLRTQLRKQRGAMRRAAAADAAIATSMDRSREPSFLRNLRDLRRGVLDLNVLDPSYSTPLAQIPRKLRNYRLAASHGVSPPEVFAVWESLDEVDLADLPPEFVMKSNRGAGGRGVLPLLRPDAGVYQVIGSDRRLSQQDVIEHFRRGAPSVAGPFFAEKLLNQGDGILPDDIKLYMFYGEVGHVLLCRNVPGDGPRRPAFRLLDSTGADLGSDIAPTRRIDNSIPAPRDLARMVEIGRHLSQAVALPFIRVDLYETVDGPIFGELTCGPGGKQVYRPDHDAHLGWLWENGQYRLDVDVVAGRPLRNLLGEHPVSANLWSIAESQTTHPDEHQPVSCGACAATLFRADARR